MNLEKEKNTQENQEQTAVETLDKIEQELLDSLEADLSQENNDQPIALKKRGRLLAKELWDSLIKKYPLYAEFITSLTEAFSSGSEWFQLTTNLVATHKDDPLIMKKFWEIISRMHISESHRRGVVFQATAMQIFENLGFSVRLATPTEDASTHQKQGIDIFVDGIPFQVKANKYNEAAVSILRRQHSSKGEWWEIYLKDSASDPYTGKPDPIVVQ